MVADETRHPFGGHLFTGTTQLAQPFRWEHVLQIYKETTYAGKLAYF